MKRCSKCGEDKPSSDFHRATRESDGLQRWCKTCCASYASERWRNDELHRERSRENNHRYSKENSLHRKYYNLKRYYGLSPEDYELLLMEQDGKCAICSRIMTPPYVDHDHSCCPGVKSCGKCIRGLLCISCNAHLGWYEANEDAIGAYLEGRRVSSES